MSSSSSSSSTENTATAPTTPTSVAKLQTLNYVNVAAYLSNFLVVFGSTRAGIPDNATLSNKYQTLVTPAPYAFAIWGIIFTAELVWTVLQVLPYYRSHELVVKSVGYNFALACLAQCAWTIAFGLEHMVLALICMIGILIPLVSILIKTCETSGKATTTGDYWKLKFPFQIHGAWIMAATLVNFNVVAVAYEASSQIQTIVGGLSLVLLFGVGIYAVVKKEAYRRAYCVPSVLAWASLAIGKELANPRDQIVATFSESTIAHTQMASTVVAYILLLVMAIELARSLFLNKNDSESEGEESQGEYTTLS